MTTVEILRMIEEMGTDRFEEYLEEIRSEDGYAPLPCCGVKYSRHRWECPFVKKVWAEGNAIFTLPPEQP